MVLWFVAVMMERLGRANTTISALAEAGASSPRLMALVTSRCAAYFGFLLLNAFLQCCVAALHFCVAFCLLLGMGLSPLPVACVAAILQMPTRPPGKRLFAWK